MRRATAQQAVHFRALANLAQAGLARHLERLRSVAEGLSRTAIEPVDAEDRIARLRRDQTTPAREALERATDTIIRAAAEGARRADAAAAAAASATRGALLWTGAGVALLLALSGWMTTRAITRPLARLQSAVERIAAGDATAAVPDQARRDEICRIAVALEALRGTVGRAFAQQQMLEQLPVGVVTAAPRADLRITYPNPEARDPTTGGAPAALPDR